ncbi:hypothetical protein NKR23_g58 [Pleurostoma richardsiae]|uniref:Uncharacterized protein n=1 Tax=Pleurostoma richardsiae TaxID=41990 RepID=A0AA38VLL2_9PEZI|nr:hypothetical protein NKR23_g58 [Pleurostoma richardsiae]
MEAVSLYSFSTLGWLSIQAMPLILWPTFISSMLVNEYQPANSVEAYFARSLGFTQLALSLVLVCLSGALPLTSMVDNPTDGISPYANAAVLLTTLYHGTAGFYSYARYSTTGQAGYMVGCVGSSVLAAFGLWVLMFGSGSHISRRTGADKRMSGFPFRNTEAAKRRPKEL